MFSFLYLQLNICNYVPADDVMISTVSFNNIKRFKDWVPIHDQPQSVKDYQELIPLFALDDSYM